MPGKVKAALLGGAVGAFVIVFIEFTSQDDGFFADESSWLLLVLAVVVFGWFQVRAYNRKKGIYADRDDGTDEQ